jgi:hypothetical protein
MSIPSVLNERTPAWVWLIIAIAIIALIIFSNSDKIDAILQTNQISATQTALVQTQTAIALGIPVGTQAIPTNSTLGLATVSNIEVSPPTPQLQPTKNAAHRPSHLSIANGETFSPLQGWGWICTGDLSITLSNGTRVSLYDNVQQTGLLLVIEPNSEIIVNAPFGGYCEPYSQGEKDRRVLSITSMMLDEGCVGGCSSINTKEIDKTGTVVSDQWSS